MIDGHGKPTHIRTSVSYLQKLYTKILFDYLEFYLFYHYLYESLQNYWSLIQLINWTVGIQFMAVFVGPFDSGPGIRNDSENILIFL